MKKPAKRRPGASALGIFRVFLLCLLGIFVVSGGVILGIYWLYAADLPLLTTMNDYRPPIITEVYDVRGRLIGEFFEERRKPVGAEEIPALLKQAFVAIEDERFFEHSGVDYKGILRALYIDLREMGMVQGASTITMQLARTFFLSLERTLSRKIKEAILALRIERNFTKEEILTLYLNQIYLGHGAYGVGAAAQEYFGKKVGELTLAECATLAALPKAPANYDPFGRPVEARQRRNLVLSKMLELGMISPEEFEKAKNEPFNLKRRINPTRQKAPYFVEEVRQYLIKQYGRDTVYRQGLKVFTTVDAEWTRHAYEALREGLRKHDKAMGWRGPIKHLEKSEWPGYIQKLAERYPERPGKGEYVEALIVSVPGGSRAYAWLRIGDHKARMPEEGREWMEKINYEPYEQLANVPKPTRKLRPGDVVQVKIRGYDREDTSVVSLEQEPMVQGAVLTVDPFTGEVRVMVGGRDFGESEFNRAIMAKRQPGSAFKPILYAAALSSGYTPATVIIDTPIILQGPNGPWKPRNYGERFSGPRTLASALQHSVNTISVRLMKDVGVDKVIKLARELGIESKLNRDLSLALGTASIKLSELVRALGTFATGGRLAPMIYVRRVYDRDGQILEDRVPTTDDYGAVPESMEEFKVWSEQALEPFWGGNGLNHRIKVAERRGRKVLSPEISYVMTSLLRNVVRSGTGTNAHIKGVEIAGKTGTTNDYKDALFIGYSTCCVTGVWVGHDSGKLTLGKNASGGEVAAPIWQNYMYPVLKGHSIPSFPRPEGVVTYTFDPITGTFPCPDTRRTIQAAFLEGTKPADCRAAPGMDMDLFRYDVRPSDSIPF